MLSIILFSRLSPYINEAIGVISMDFDKADQLLILHFAFVRYWRKNGSTMRQYFIYS
jgi:hypothetical protein